MGNTLPKLHQVIEIAYKNDPNHSDDIFGAKMLWKPKEARILKNFIDQPM
jgi:hypothetical protein